MAETTAPLLGAAAESVASPERVVRKLFLRIVPVAMLTTVFCYMNRGNLGFAANTFCADMRLSASAYGLGAALFYIGYTTLQIPVSIILPRVGAPVVLGSCLVTWGIVSSVMGFITTPLQFYVLRTALGFTQAATFPTIWYYFSAFFPESGLTLALAMVELATTLASPASTPFAVGLLSMDGKWGIPGWRWLFFVEGIFPIILGAYVLVCWPSTIASASFLTPTEKEWLLQNVKETKTKNDVVSKPINVLEDTVSKMKSVMQSVWFWVLTFAAFVRSVVLEVVCYFTILIIHAFLDEPKSDNVTEGSATCSSSDSLGLGPVALSAIPFTFAAGAAYIVALVAQKTGQRGRLGGLATIVPAFFFMSFPTIASLGKVWGFVTFSVGVSACFAPFACIVSLLISHMPDGSRAMGLALFNTLGMVGGFVGPAVTGYMVESSGQNKGIGAYSQVALAFGILLLLAGTATFFVKEEPEEKIERNDLNHILIQEGTVDVSGKPAPQD